jgi:hypothetical protein
VIIRVIATFEGEGIQNSGDGKDHENNQIRNDEFKEFSNSQIIRKQQNHSHLIR